MFLRCFWMNYRFWPRVEYLRTVFWFLEGTHWGSINLISTSTFIIKVGRAIWSLYKTQWGRTELGSSVHFCFNSSISKKYTPYNIILCNQTSIKMQLFNFRRSSPNCASINWVVKIRDLCLALSKRLNIN